MNSALTIKPLAESTFGAVVENLDVETVVGQGAPLEVWDELYAAWIEYALLILPEVFLTREQQVALAKRFGSIELLGGQEIVALSNVTPSGALRGEDDVMKVLRGNMDWHVDSTYMPLQSKGAVFSAEVVPAEGGGTGFADMRAAYAALDDDTKSMADGLSAHHSLHHSQRAHGHVHSEDSDYVGYGLEHSGDAVIWDNRCLLHRARPWDMTEPRTMWHARIAGDNESEFAPLASDTGTAA